MSIPEEVARQFAAIDEEKAVHEQRLKELDAAKRKLLFSQFIAKWVDNDEYKELCLAHVTSPPIFEHDYDRHGEEEFSISYTWDGETICISATRDCDTLHVDFDDMSYGEDTDQDWDALDANELPAHKRLAIILMRRFVDEWEFDNSYWY